MAVGYSTLDLVMLLIAIFVVCVAIRTPKTSNKKEESALLPGLKPGNQA